MLSVVIVSLSEAGRAAANREEVGQVRGRSSGSDRAGKGGRAGGSERATIVWEPVMRTKLLKRGKDQVVRIPRELRFEPPTDEVDIERLGDALIVRPIGAPIRRRLTNVLEKFRAFSPHFTAR